MSTPRRGGKGKAPALVGAKRPLTAKQEKFCQEYQKDCNATQAAIRAGYSPKTSNEMGAENLAKPSIKARVKELQDKFAADNGISIAWVLDGLKSNAERAMQAEPVYDREGEPTGEYRYEGNVANRAYELIGKHLGMFTEQAEKPPALPSKINITFTDPPKRGKHG